MPKSILPILISSALALLLYPGQSQEPSSPSFLPEQVISELQAANHARAQRLREEQEWAMEKARLQFLRETLERKTARPSAPRQ